MNQMTDEWVVWRFDIYLSDGSWTVVEGHACVRSHDNALVITADYGFVNVDEDPEDSEVAVFAPGEWKYFKAKMLRPARDRETSQDQIQAQVTHR